MWLLEMKRKFKGPWGLAASGRPYTSSAFYEFVSIDPATLE